MERRVFTNRSSLAGSAARDAESSSSARRMNSVRLQTGSAGVAPQAAAPSNAGAGFSLRAENGRVQRLAGVPPATRSNAEAFPQSLPGSYSGSVPVGVAARSTEEAEQRAAVSEAEQVVTTASRWKNRLQNLWGNVTH